MKSSERSRAALLLLQFLKNYASPESPVTIADITAMFNEFGITADRRSIYSLLDDINDTVQPVHKMRFHNHHTYTFQPDISYADAHILLEAISINPALPYRDKLRLSNKIKALLPIPQHLSLPEPNRTNPNVQTTYDALQVLLEAIRTGHLISFLYFDKDPLGRKKYRHDKKPYILQPMQILFSNDRYYCICWSNTKKQPLNFRIDKMDHITITQDLAVPVTFDLDSYMNKTFHMYTGTSQTITIRCQNAFSSVLYDSFSEDTILINACDTDTFTVTIRTAIVPTLISWLFQFHKEVEVLCPQSLIETLVHIANEVSQTYNM